MIIVKNRELLIPNNERYIGTTYDTDTENRVFQVPRFSQRGVDLAALTFRLDIQYANESYDTVILDKEVGEAFIILIWKITSATLQVPGTLYIGLRAIDDEATVKWSSFSAAMYAERHLNTPGNYGGSLTEIEQIEQDHQYMKGVVDELKSHLDYTHEAEAWAIGKKDGEDVPSTDETYHNNSKYYSDQASTKATQAANSATAAANSATQAAETVSDTNTRFNNAMAGVTSETEVIDARVGADGTQYTVLKNRLDAEHTQLKNAVVSHNLCDLMHKSNRTANGITFTWQPDGSCVVEGTATATTIANLFNSTTSLPQGINAGDTIQVKYTCESSKVYFYIYDYTDSDPVILCGINSNGLYYVKIPDTCTGLLIRLWVGGGTALDSAETVKPEIYSGNWYIPSVDTASSDETGKTDMREAIQQALNIYGYCKLGPGDYYVSAQISMPEGSTVEGCGKSTVIRLMSGNHKNAFLMTKYCTIRNLTITGSYDDLSESDFGTSSGSRYGILYYKGSSDTYSTAHCSISNVFIKNFTGSGIYQYNTGGNVEQGLFVSNVHIKNCWCGIHCHSYSEFCRYSNVQITYCYIACINNGGNNSFSNCVFHAYSIGFQIIGSRNNSAHGICSNSSFCHTGNNVGSAITIDDVTNGYIFSAIQVWYNSIDISNSSGIIFSGAEFGRGTTGAGATINIDGGNTILFNGCMFMDDENYAPNITITNNTKVKFANCYGSVSGNAIAA